MIVTLNENQELEVSPSDINMSSFIPKKKLNKNIWKNDTIDSKLRLHLLDISTDFIKYIGLSHVKPIDIILTGSLCNYNWSKFSDLDIHIIFDFTDINADVKLVREYFNLKKNEWNNDHNLLTIFGFKVEFYVEDIGQTKCNSGKYSLFKNKWLCKPNAKIKKGLSVISEDNIKELSSYLMSIIDEFEEIVNKTTNVRLLNKILDVIYLFISILKGIRTYDLDKNGEMSVGNITYKVLRRTNYLNKIWDLSKITYDKINSI